MNKIRHQAVRMLLSTKGDKEVRGDGRKRQIGILALVESWDAAASVGPAVVQRDDRAQKSDRRESIRVISRVRSTRSLSSPSIELARAVYVQSMCNKMKPLPSP